MAIVPELQDIKGTIERLYNCKASYFEDKTVWSGIVHVFKIESNPKTDTCYAWSFPIEGSTKRRYYAVLKIPPIDLPEKAVRASIIQDHKTEQIK